MFTPHLPTVSNYWTFYCNLTGKSVTLVWMQTTHNWVIIIIITILISIT